MAIVYVNIGSNLGNRAAHISRAIDLISESFGIYCKSEMVESEPWGFESTNSFFNIGVSFKSELPPERILDILQGIEREVSEVAHRDENGGYKDREVDIDIMAIDDMRYESERLILPHRHLYSRDFFLKPLRELLPGSGCRVPDAKGCGVSDKG